MKQMIAYLTVAITENRLEAVWAETFVHLKQKQSLCEWQRVHLLLGHADQQAPSI
jgi:hypothetical protein